jgi:RND family efflux transporter MFP subunit
VSKGDPILTIDPIRLQLKKDQSDLDIERAQLERTIAQRDFDNGKKLLETGTVSTSQLQDLETKFMLADINYRQQKLNLDDIVDQLSKTVVKSPMSGVITSLDVEEGEIAISATSGLQSGTSIGTVSDITRLEVISQVGEADYIHVGTGQKVVLKPEAVEGAQTMGTITFVSLSAKRANADDLGTFEVRISIDSIIPGISPGININVEFVINEKKNVVGVPNSFVLKRPKGSSVLVVESKDGKEIVVPRKVELGLTDYKNYEVLRGLKVGDIIVSRDAEVARPKKNGAPGGGGPGGR